MAAEQQTRVKGASGGNRFAAACGMLRQYQYMMGQGSGSRAAMATMGLMPGADGVEAAHVTPEERIKNTMELLLFPPRPGTLMDNSHQRILEPERAQLTIFYDGRTFVLDDFPAEKADQLMQLAGSFAAPAASDDELVCPSMPAQHFLGGIPALQNLCVCSGMPRKASLQRFLEQRKGRIAAADPYLVAPARAAKETAKPVAVGDGGAPWLSVNCGLNLN
nr:protein TIFY 11c-like isoform X5 [Lolium perenne]